MVTKAASSPYINGGQLILNETTYVIDLTGKDLEGKSSSQIADIQKLAASILIDYIAKTYEAGHDFTKDFYITKISFVKVNGKLTIEDENRKGEEKTTEYTEKDDFSATTKDMVTDIRYNGEHPVTSYFDAVNAIRDIYLNPGRFDATDKAKPSTTPSPFRLEGKLQGHKTVKAPTTAGKPDPAAPTAEAKPASDTAVAAAQAPDPHAAEEAPTPEKFEEMPPESEPIGNRSWFERFKKHNPFHWVWNQFHKKDLADYRQRAEEFTVPATPDDPLNPVESAPGAAGRTEEHMDTVYTEKEAADYVDPLCAVKKTPTGKGKGAANPIIQYRNQALLDAQAVIDNDAPPEKKAEAYNTVVSHEIREAVSLASSKSNAAQINEHVTAARNNAREIQLLFVNAKRSNTPIAAAIEKIYQEAQDRITEAEKTIANLSKGGSAAGDPLGADRVTTAGEKPKNRKGKEPARPATAPATDTRIEELD